MLATRSVSQFIDDVSSTTPAPGGGSVSALCGALGAALAAMVCRLTIGKKKYEAVQDELLAALGHADQLRADLTALIDQDTAAFNAVMEAFGLPKETEEQRQTRSSAIQEATKGATLVPLRVMQLCEEALQVAVVVAEKGNVNSITDAGVAGLVLKAGCEGAAYNVRINLATLQDKVFIDETTTLMTAVATTVDVLADKVRERVEAVLS